MASKTDGKNVHQTKAMQHMQSILDRLVETTPQLRDCKHDLHCDDTDSIHRDLDKFDPDSFEIG